MGANRRGSDGVAGTPRTSTRAGSGHTVRSPEIPWELVCRCPEAQADGVPCPDVTTDCSVCGRAHRILRPVIRWLPHQG